MEPSQRNAAALNQRIASLTASLLSHYATILDLASPASSLSSSTIPSAPPPTTNPTTEDEEDEDAAPPTTYSLSATAHTSLRIKEESTALITTAQRVSMLIRELQELWLFGGLDTLGEGERGEVERERVMGIAARVEGLVRAGVERVGVKVEGEGEDGVRVKVEKEGD